MDWLAFTASAFLGLCFGSLIGANLSDYSTRLFANKVWAEIMGKRVDVERKLTQVEEDAARHRNGGFDLGQR